MNDHDSWVTGATIIEAGDNEGNITLTDVPSRRYERIFRVTGFGNGDFIDATPGVFEKDWIVGPTGFERTEFLVTSPLVAYTYLHGDMRQHWSIPPTSEDWHEDADLYNNCLTKLYNAVHQGLNGSLGVDVAEVVHGGADIGRGISNLAAALRNPLNTVGTLTKAFGEAAYKYGRGPKTRKSVRAINNAYLNYTYGMGATASDIYDVLRDKVPPLAQTQTVSARKARTRVDSQVDTDYIWPGFTRASVFEMSLRYEIEVSFYVSNPSLFNLNRLVSLNPINYWWQLTRLSFVVDWLIDISEFLSNLESALGLGLTFERGYVTITSRSNGRTVYTGDSIHSNISRLGQGAGYRVRSYKNRYALTSFPMPALPRFKKPFNFGSRRLANAASLLAGASSILTGRRA